MRWSLHFLDEHAIEERIGTRNRGSGRLNARSSIAASGTGNSMQIDNEQSLYGHKNEAFHTYRHR
ncbi:MAG TPA: hypothetical protein VK658_12385 [Chryseolinea sp.]|nr:hypothetical protein [Chryseolinea sp.]